MGLLEKLKTKSTEFIHDVKTPLPSPDASMRRYLRIEVARLAVALTGEQDSAPIRSRIGAAGEGSGPPVDAYTVLSETERAKLPEAAEFVERIAEVTMATTMPLFNKRPDVASMLQRGIDG